MAYPISMIPPSGKVARINHPMTPIAYKISPKSIPKTMHGLTNPSCNSQSKHVAMPPAMRTEMIGETVSSRIPEIT